MSHPLREYAKAHPFLSLLYSGIAVALAVLGFVSLPDEVAGALPLGTWLLTTQWGRGVLVLSGVAVFLTYWVLLPELVRRVEQRSRSSEVAALRSAMDDIVTGLEGISMVDHAAAINEIQRAQGRAIVRLRLAHANGLLDRSVPIDAVPSDEHRTWVAMARWAEARWPGELSPLSDIGEMRIVNGTEVLMYHPRETPALRTHAVSLIKTIMRNCVVSRVTTQSAAC